MSPVEKIKMTKITRETKTSSQITQTPLATSTIVTTKTTTKTLTEPEGRAKTV